MGWEAAAFWSRNCRSCNMRCEELIGIVGSSQGKGAVGGSGADCGQYNRPVRSHWGLAPRRVIVAAGGPKEPDRL